MPSNPMIHFLLRSDGAYCMYESMTSDQVGALLADISLTALMITEQQYKEGLAAL